MTLFVKQSIIPDLSLKPVNTRFMTLLSQTLLLTRVKSQFPTPENGKIVSFSHPKMEKMGKLSVFSRNLKKKCPFWRKSVHFDEKEGPTVSQWPDSVPVGQTVCQWRVQCTRTHTTVGQYWSTTPRYHHVPGTPIPTPHPGHVQSSRHSTRARLARLLWIESIPKTASTRVVPRVPKQSLINLVLKQNVKTGPGLGAESQKSVKNWEILRKRDKSWLFHCFTKTTTFWLTFLVFDTALRKQNWPFRDLSQFLVKYRIY